MGVVPNRILIHTAVPVSYVEDGLSAEWIEGEPGQSGVVRTAGEPFACVLFLPTAGGAQQNQYRSKVTRSPTLLYNPTRDYSRAGVPELVADGTPIVVTDENELVIYAPELAPWTGGISPARWLVDGDAQPFGPPGKVYGIQASLSQVQD